VSLAGDTLRDSRPLSPPHRASPALRPLGSDARVDLVDPHSGGVLCPVKPLDKSANADGQRRRLTPVTTDLSPLPSSGLAPLLRQLLADYAATGLPPAYLPPLDQDPA
jgi:putative transposase